MRCRSADTVPHRSWTVPKETFFPLVGPVRGRTARSALDIGQRDLERRRPVRPSRSKIPLSVVTIPAPETFDRVMPAASLSAVRDTVASATTKTSRPISSRPASVRATRASASMPPSPAVPSARAEARTAGTGRFCISMTAGRNRVCGSHEGSNEHRVSERRRTDVDEAPFWCTVYHTSANKGMFRCFIRGRGCRP